MKGSGNPEFDRLIIDRCEDIRCLIETYIRGVNDIPDLKTSDVFAGIMTMFSTGIFCLSLTVEDSEGLFYDLTACFREHLKTMNFDTFMNELNANLTRGIPTINPLT